VDGSWRHGLAIRDHREDHAVAFDVRTLRAALRRDLATSAARHFGSEPLWANLSHAARGHLGRLVDWLGTNRPDVYAAFAGEGDLGVALADAAERLDGIDWTLSELLDNAVSDAVGTWVVPVPLVGVAAPTEVCALDDALLLTPASAWRNDRVDTSELRRDVARLCGAPADIGSRYVHGVDDQLVDTRRTATLICTLHGTRERCRRIAFEQCRFLVAGWTLLAPPEAETHTPMWPQITEWQPQPQLHVQEATHRIEMNAESTKHSGMTIVHGPDDAAFWPWPEDETIATVLRALRAAERSRAATALITAAWDLYLAARNPSDAPWIERLVHIMHAREALCEHSDGDNRNLEGRFRAACASVDVADALTARGWGPGDLQRIGGELRRLRNLATHSSDVSRLRLGHTPVRERPKLDSPRIADTYVREAASPAYHAVRELCIRLWIDMDQRDYDDGAYERVFVA
jgi:hypothetical protein